MKIRNKSSSVTILRSTGALQLISLLFFAWPLEKLVLSEDQEFLTPRWINYPANVFFYLKLVTIALAYVLIMVSIFGSFWT